MENDKITIDLDYYNDLLEYKIKFNMLNSYFMSAMNNAKLNFLQNDLSFDDEEINTIFKLALPTVYKEKLEQIKGGK